MTLAWNVEEHETCAATDCPGCRQRDRRIEELESKLQHYQRSSDWRAPTILILGSQLLATLPSLTLWCGIAAAEIADNLHPVVFGFVVAELFASFAVFGICAMLNWRPLWQRGLIFLPAFAAAGASSCLVSIALDLESSLEPLSDLSLLPTLMLVALLPCFAVRIGRRWTLAPLDRPVQPRPTSIATLLVATGICAMAAACIRFFEPGEGVTSPTGEFGILLVTLSYLAIPAFCVGLTLTLCLRVALANTARMSWPAICGLIVATPLALAGVAAGMCSMVQVNGQRLSWDDVLGSMLMASAAGAGTLVVGLASFLGMRWAGYRLLSGA